ncbi:hypothetical protein BU24DRAFT_346929 [Aaosphaeria arxii CBS 175.79]|uniref:UBX domain-containing protein n=1 Tax=Aaosphaeria arxii CBS 175.79 TaxID=1450172 RepID=A0A6A5XRG1_9PLEO|nr:uncharacterized protein BU24DRAFT_346929 [Aaosphaeria arxii CBS 175.79]KAF2015895.1 hypothetical protein BU24DRAFT_346929 [Aaosphaeria arxii CBS 175.79]
MSHVVVFNASAKTVRIPTTPTKYLTEVRDEACQKFSVSKDQFTLKYNNKPISLSQQIRLANLPQGARLELVQASRSPTVISVALQLPASDKSARLTQKFASNTSLWELLRKFESGQGANYNFTQRGVPEMSANGTSGAGRLHYEMPVITVMPGHREHASFVELQKTLSQIGFDSGSALLRLSFRNSGKPLEEAMTEISQYFRASDATPSGAHAATTAQTTSIPDLDKAAPEATQIVAGESIKVDEPEPDLMDVDPAPASASAEVPTASQPTGNVESTSIPSPVQATSPLSETSAEAASGRNVQIFAASPSSTPQAARQAYNEADYIPTIEHAKSHQAALQARTRNQRLLSDKELEDQEKARQEKLNAAADKGSSVRIRMPDTQIIQINITKEDTAKDIYIMVEDFLLYKEPFNLKYIGPKGQQTLLPRDQKRLIQDLRFTAAELVTFLWDDKASSEARLSRKILKQEWQARAQVLQVKEPVAEEKPKAAPQQEPSKAEGKKKSNLSAGEKESKLKNLLMKGFSKK